MMKLLLGLPAIRGIYIMVIGCLVLIGCNLRKPDAQEIIANAVAAHGWQNYKQGVISFRQDGTLYRVLRDGDATLFSRTFTNTSGQYVHDVLDGTGFTRAVEGQEVPLNEQEREEHREALRTVVVFALLPYTLKESRLKTEYTGDVNIKGEHYNKVKVTVERSKKKVTDPPEGIYQLWVHQERHTLDYFVYTPANKEGNSVFCEAVSPRTIKGLRFQNYDIYATDNRISAVKLDYAYESSELKKVSEMKLEDIIVAPLPPL